MALKRRFGLGNITMIVYRLMAAAQARQIPYVALGDLR
jgi:hypothetical protein